MVICQTCSRTFGYEQDAFQHMNAVAHWGCDICSRTFKSNGAATQHKDALGHWACDTCSDEFWTEEDAIEHMEEEHDTSDDEEYWEPSFECEACYDTFDTEREVRCHMQDMNHYRTYWCQECERGFQNENNLKMHLNSNIHRGAQISCPFCRRAFTTATGVTHHLETGSCSKAKSINRDTILAEIRHRDPNNLITKKLLTYPSDGQAEFTATTRCWNGSFYECYLCHRDFQNMQSLDQHLNSPRHRQKTYHCPGRTCPKEFASLASLFNHLESESCGTLRFATVQRNVDGFLKGGNKMIAFR